MSNGCTPAAGSHYCALPQTFPEVPTAGSLSAAPERALARMHAGGVTPAGLRDLGAALGVDAPQLVRAGGPGLWKTSQSVGVFQTASDAWRSVPDASSL